MSAIKNYSVGELSGDKVVYLGGLDYTDAGRIIENFRLAANIIEKMFLQAEESIRMVGLEPRDFDFDWKTDERPYPASFNVTDFLSEKTEFALVYTCDLDGTRYEFRTFANIQKGQKPVRILTVVLKREESGWYEYEDGKWFPTFVIPLTYTT